VLGNPIKDYYSLDVDFADTIAAIYATALQKLL